jgi:hypothetical protein
VTPAQVSAWSEVSAWAVRLGAAVGTGILAWGYFDGRPVAVGLGAGLLAAWVIGGVWAGWVIAAIALRAAAQLRERK